MKIGIRAIDLDGFVPDYRLHPELGLPVELYERRFPVRGHQTVSVYSESLHEAE